MYKCSALNFATKQPEVAPASHWLMVAHRMQFTDTQVRLSVTT